MESVEIGRAVLGRLPHYLQYLKNLPDDGSAARVSATTIARALGLGEVQVRKDLQQISGTGRPKIGYDAAELTAQLERALGYHDVSEAVIVGAGRLGRALLDYRGFEIFGLRIAAAFDEDPDKLGTTQRGGEVYPMSRLTEFIRERGIRIGIITVPSSAAQSVCDVLTGVGVSAIWNFAPVTLNVPENVVIQNENLALSLAHLKSQISL